MNFSQKIVDFERFCQVVSRPGLDAFDGVERPITRRQENDGNVLKFGQQADPPRELKTIEPRHHDIQDHQLRPDLRRERQGTRPIASADDVVFASEHSFEQTADRGIIIGDEYSLFDFSA